MLQETRIAHWQQNKEVEKERQIEKRTEHQCTNNLLSMPYWGICGEGVWQIGSSTLQQQAFFSNLHFQGYESVVACVPLLEQLLNSVKASGTHLSDLNLLDYIFCHLLFKHNVLFLSHRLFSTRGKVTPIVSKQIILFALNSAPDNLFRYVSFPLSFHIYFQP